MPGTRPTQLGYSPSSHSWGPRRYDFYARQRVLQAGAWAGSDSGAESPVDKVIRVFRTRGTGAGLWVAKSHGHRMLRGAEVYLDHRADTEESLAAAVAALQARRAQGEVLDSEALAFLTKRLAVVRDAVAAGRTPPQAVVDRPEIPRREVPRWVPFVAIGLSVFALFRSGRRHS